MGPQFFASGDELRAWFVSHHDTADELIVAMGKVGTGRPSVTWSEAVDQALCFGWIDGVRRRIDEHAFSNRFTPRRPRSNWSSINLAKVEALIASGLVQPAGLAAYENRLVRAAAYSFEQPGELALDPLQEQAFRAVPEAWVFFESRSAAYRKRAIWWVLSAKREETRVSRLARLIELSATRQTL